MTHCLPSMRIQTDVRVTVEKDMMKARRMRMGWIRAELAGGGAQQRAWWNALATDTRVTITTTAAPLRPDTRHH